MYRIIKNFCLRKENAAAFTSLGQIRYLSCLNHFDMFIGNSSSGLAEVPCFKIPTVNIGDRQRGRLKAASVIDCKPLDHEIHRSILRALSPEFKKICSDVTNPYGSGGASSAIINKLEQMDNVNFLKKNFYDIPINI